MTPAIQSQIATSHSDASVPGSLLASVGGSMVVILLVAACLLWAIRRIKGIRPVSGAAAGLSVISSHALGQRERLVVVDMQDKRMLIGVTASQITCLQTFERPEEMPLAAPQNGGADFKQALMKRLKMRAPGGEQ